MDFCFRNDVIFLEFPYRGRPDHRPLRLSHYVRAEITRHREQQTCASASASDSDV